jgi:DNA polymerase-1
MQGHLILVDGNNLGFAAMANPRLHAGDRPTQSTFGVIRSLHKLFIDNPDALVMILWDGRSWRHNFFSDYKANREVTEKQTADRQEYYKQKNTLVQGLDYLGITQCSASNMEADDLAEIYARKWKGDKLTLLSGDKDWLQLVDERTTWLDPIRNRQCTNLNFESFTGCKDVKQFLERKYILGDAGDNIKGLNGVGEKTLDKLYQIWDSITNYLVDSQPHMKWQTIHGEKLPSRLTSLNPDDVFDVLTRNETLMNLSTVSRPEPINMVRRRQNLDTESFRAFCYENAFISLLKDYDKFLQPFKENKYVRIGQTSEVT